MCSVCRPESVSDAVLKEEEALVIHPQKVTAVDVEVSLHKHISQLLLLCLLPVLGVAAKR